MALSYENAEKTAANFIARWNKATTFAELKAIREELKICIETDQIPKDITLYYGYYRAYIKGDDSALEKMLECDLPETPPDDSSEIWMKTESTGIKIIPLKPKAHYKRGFRLDATDIYIAITLCIMVGAILIAHFIW